MLYNREPKYPDRELIDIKDKKTLVALMRVNKEINALVALTNAIIAYSGGIFAFKKDVQNVLVDDRKDADYSISTIHKSKGLEFDKIVLVDDFVNEDSDVPILEQLEQDQGFNLLYVAVSRARYSVVMQAALQDALEF